MATATSIKRAGDWSGPAADTVVLTYHDRHRRRLAMTGVGGLSFVLDLEKATVLQDGDALDIAEPWASMGNVGHW